MRGFLLLYAFLLFSFSVPAQGTFTFEPTQNRPGNREPLPAEEFFTVNGPLLPTTSRVELHIFNKQDSKKEKPVFMNSWEKKELTADLQRFYIPVTQNLHGNREYDLQITYFQPASEEHNRELRSSLVNYLQTYLREHTAVTEKKIQLKKRPEALLRDMNAIVQNALSTYRLQEGQRFDGFSDLVRTKVENLHSNRLKDIDKLLGTGNSREAKMDYYQQQQGGLTDLIAFEINNLLQENLFKRTEQYFLNNYPTEETRNVFTLHAGYGGIFLDGPIDRLSYASGPYAGLSFPLGKKAFASPFWYNTSFVSGVYLSNMEGEGDRTISGPIIKRPVYAGLSYKLFEFVSLTAGAVVLENEETAGAFNDLGNKVYVRPFIGLQADFRIWLDLAR